MLFNIDHRSKFICVIILYLVTFHSALAQFDLFPSSFGLISGINMYQCPSNIGLNNRIEGRLMHQNYAGGWEKVSNSLLMLNYSIKDKSGINHNTFGFMATSYRQGKYINLNPLYFSYSWKTKITKKLFFSGGIKAGMVDYAIQGTPSTGSGSSIVPDAAASVSLYNKSFLSSFGINSAFNSKLQPFYEIHTLKRYAVFYHEQTIRHKQSFRSKISILVQYPSYINYDVMVNYEFSMKEKFCIGTGYHKRGGMNFLIGLTNLKFYKGSGNLYVLYNYPIVVKDLSINRLELFLSFFIK